MVYENITSALRNLGFFVASYALVQTGASTTTAHKKRLQQGQNSANQKMFLHLIFTKP
jgi:hypothetical protein